jgi:hypothetical protein
MKNNTANAAQLGRAWQEISFQASILALQSAIESAGRGGQTGDSDVEDQLRSLVRLVPRRATKGLPLSNTRGL